RLIFHIGSVLQEALSPKLGGAAAVPASQEIREPDPPGRPAPVCGQNSAVDGWKPTVMSPARTDPPSRPPDAPFPRTAGSSRPIRELRPTGDVNGPTKDGPPVLPPLPKAAGSCATNGRICSIAPLHSICAEPARRPAGLPLF